MDSLRRSGLLLPPFHRSACKHLRQSHRFADIRSQLARESKDWFPRPLKTQFSRCCGSRCGSNESFEHGNLCPTNPVSIQGVTRFSELLTTYLTPLSAGAEVAADAGAAAAKICLIMVAQLTTVVTRLLKSITRIFQSANHLVNPSFRRCRGRRCCRRRSGRSRARSPERVGHRSARPVRERHVRRLEERPDCNRDPRPSHP